MPDKQSENQVWIAPPTFQRLRLQHAWICALYKFCNNNNNNNNTIVEWVFSWRRKDCSDDDEMTASGRPFQTWAAVTGKPTADANSKQFDGRYDQAAGTC